MKTKKTMKKILTLLLAAALAGAMATSAAAVEEDAVLRSYQEPELMVEEEPITAEHSYITYGKDGDGIVLRTTSISDTVAIRIQGGTAATSESEGLSIENGVVTMSKELCDTILVEGENCLNFVFSDGVLEVVIFVTEEEPITADHTNITYGRGGDGIVIRTNSTSDYVAIRIQGGTAATSDSEGLSIENGVVTMSKELCDAILAGGENDLHFVFEDGFIEVTIFVTNDTPAPVPGTDIPKTGDTTSAMAVTAVLLSSLAAAAFLSMKRRKAEQE